MKQIDYVCDCPGAWYGNNPDAYGRGNIVVDPAKIVDAVRWLGKRLMLSTGTELTSDGGIFLEFQVRYARKPDGTVATSAA